jgi:phage terminase large subunit-like protein
MLQTTDFREFNRMAAGSQISAMQADNDIYRNNNQTYGEQLIEWIESEFYVPEMLKLRPDRPAMLLAPYQKAALKEALRQDADGRFVYDFVLWSDIKKSIKSSIAAAVVLYRALRTDWGSFKIIANDLEQADSRVFFYIRRALELNPKLKATATIRNYKITFTNNSFIQAIPVDPDGEAGGNDDMLEFTELHGFKSKAAQKLWTEATVSPTKHGYAQRWADTYAGNSGESPILEPLYNQLVQPENLLDIGVDGLEVYAKGKIFCLWNTEPRMTIPPLLNWQTPDYYASESVLLLPNEFLRVHRNQWTSSINVFVPIEWWNACEDELPVFADDEPMVVSLDAAVSGDCFAMIGVSRRGDKTYKRFCRIWKPEKNRKLEYANIHDVNDKAYPEGECRRLAREYNVVQFAYDPYQLHDMASRLMAEGIGWFRPFQQGQDRLIADKQFYDDIRDRRFIHDGDSGLTEHVKNANAKLDTESSKLRIIKRAEHLPIDACVAASMANSESRRLNL